MDPDKKKSETNSGTRDGEYTWGRPVTAYVSSLQYMRLLLLKARLNATLPERLD